MTPQFCFFVTKTSSKPLPISWHGLIPNVSEIALLLVYSFAFLHLTAVAHEGGGEECVIVFENEDMRVRVRNECNKTNPIEEAKIVEHYPVSATLETFDFDDNVSCGWELCFTNCVYQAEGLMAEDGTLKKDEAQHFFKSNMTSQLFTKLTALFYACIDSTNQISEVKGLNPCKKASLHEFCIVKGIISSHDLLQMDC